MTRTPDESKKGLPLYTPEEVKAILQQKWTIHLQEKLYRSAFAYIQQLEAQNAAVKKTFDEVEELNNRQAAIIKQLQAERDAAVADLKACVTEAAQGDDFDCCFACKYNNEYGGCDRPNYTIEACGVEDFDNKWTWRGVTEEE